MQAPTGRGHKAPVAPFVAFVDRLESSSPPVAMEGSEMEMTEKELQRWIRRKVRKNPMVVAAVERSNLLRSLLKRRENQANNLQKLCR